MRRQLLSLQNDYLFFNNHGQFSFEHYVEIKYDAFFVGRIYGGMQKPGIEEKALALSVSMSYFAMRIFDKKFTPFWHFQSQVTSSIRCTQEIGMFFYFAPRFYQ